MPPKATEEKPKRAPSTWMVALKAWNAQQPGAWCVPKKDTPEYNQVRALMAAAAPKDAPKAAPKAAPKPRAKKPAAAPTEPAAPESSASRKGKSKAKPALKVDTKAKPRKSKIDLSDSPL